MKFLLSARSRAALYGLPVALGLSACGGGGGGGASTPPPATPASAAPSCTNGATDPPFCTTFPAPTVTVASFTPTASAKDVSITGELTVNLTLANVQNVDAKATYCGRTALSANVRVALLDNSATVTVRYPDALPYSTDCTWEIQGTAYGKNAQTTTWSQSSRFTTEALGVLHYGEKVYALRGLTPLAVERKVDGGFSLTQVGNESSHRTTAFSGTSITDCVRNLRKTSTGMIWLSCVTNDDGLRRNLVMNPVRQIVRDPVPQDGAEPALTDADWVQSAPYDATTLPEWRFKAKTSTGWFVANNPPTTARFIDNAGSVTTIWNEDSVSIPAREVFFVVEN